MPSVGDIIQLTSCSTIMSQQACNVFYLVVAAWTGNMTIEEVLEYFDTDHLTGLLGEMSTQLVGASLTWRNLDNPAEVSSIVQTASGLQTGDSMGPFVATSARLYGATAETRSGWKRFAGLLEVNQVNGALTSGFEATAQAQVEVLMRDVAAPTDDPMTADAWLIQAIVGRAPDGSLDLARSQPVSSVDVQPRITTQNTRKVGRGS